MIAGEADAARREHNKRNHTATHLMHAALRNTLGTHVKQAGSLVEPGRLRFDFSHFAAIDPAELRDIEQQVNEEILLNNEIQTNVTTIDDALASGALAFFGDRYPEQNVRVVTIPDAAAARGFYSKELCGGTHVTRAGDIGVFKIMVEQSAAAGVRRIEAITGAAALAEYQRGQQILRDLSARLGVTDENLMAAIERMEQTEKQLAKQLENLKRKGALSKLDDLVMPRRAKVKGVKVISAQLEGSGPRKRCARCVDSLRQKLGSGVVVLGTVEDGKVALLAGVTKDLIPKLHAGKIIQATAKHVGGSGGGRPDLAEAGGKDTPALQNWPLTLYTRLLTNCYNFFRRARNVQGDFLVLSLPRSLVCLQMKRNRSAFPELKRMRGLINSVAIVVLGATRLMGYPCPRADCLLYTDVTGKRVFVRHAEPPAARPSQGFHEHGAAAGLRHAQSSPLS